MTALTARSRLAGSAVAAYALAALALVAVGCGVARDVPPRAARCTQCHGGEDGPAPPASVRGETATTHVSVGAHQLHLRDTPIRAAIECAECHVVPTGEEPPWHFGDSHATLTWGPLASGRSAAPSWDRDQRTCAGVYCHGATMRHPPSSPPAWTYAAEPVLAPPSAGVCGTCHGYPPAAPHPQLSACAACHPQTVGPDGAIDVAGGRHVNGRLDVRLGVGGIACDLCHGFPPSGAGHATHAGAVGDPSGGAYGMTTVLQDVVAAAATPVSAGERYAFGCGNCHPLDESRHMDGEVDVELWSAGAPPGSPKSLADPGAAYASGCSGTYCHSSGQASPVHALSPPWDSGAKLDCAGCHANPPRYPSGGAGTATANSHLVLAGDGFEAGHFGGFPSAWHAGTHGVGGGQDGSAITCQTCHFETVDPRHAGPSGFYYLDTSGDYRLPGGLLGYACGDCHVEGGRAPPASGKVLPLRHVNGVRDVVFDRRSTLSA